MRALKAIGDVKVWLHSLLSSALDGRGWLASRSGCFMPADIDQIAHWTEGLVAPTTGLNTLRKRKKILVICRKKVHFVGLGQIASRGI